MVSTNQLLRLSLAALFIANVVFYYRVWWLGIRAGDPATFALSMTLLMLLLCSIVALFKARTMAFYIAVAALVLATFSFGISAVPGLPSVFPTAYQSAAVTAVNVAVALLVFVATRRR